MTINYHRHALQELQDASDYYAKRSKATVPRFVGNVSRLLEAICRQPDFFPAIIGDVREAPVKDFPYCVYYAVITDGIFVYAICHNRRDPKTWMSRI